MKDFSTKVGLDYVSLVKLIPIGIGLSVYANVFMTVSVNDIFYHIAFFLIFFIISFDSIVEFGRLPYIDLPFKFKLLSAINGVILLLLIFSIASFSNRNFKEFSILLIFIILAMSSLLEIILSYFLGRALKDNIVKEDQIDYNENSAKFYCLWEVLFTVIYLILTYFSVSHTCLNLPLIYIALIVLIVEIQFFKKLFIVNKDQK